mmetsp:Transcript_50771/g.93865  ORF Transcript_50771/g.93865 Transcript_50771/m.93865 type:complete len:216 (-) Transcript_50771:2020-2667(-)
MAAMDCGIWGLISWISISAPFAAIARPAIIGLLPSTLSTHMRLAHHSAHVVRRSRTGWSIRRSISLATRLGAVLTRFLIPGLRFTTPYAHWLATISLSRLLPASTTRKKRSHPPTSSTLLWWIVLPPHPCSRCRRCGWHHVDTRGNLRLRLWFMQILSDRRACLLNGLLPDLLSPIIFCTSVHRRYATSLCDELRPASGLSASLLKNLVTQEHEL